MSSAGHASDRSAHPRDVASDLEVLDGLLGILTDVLDIREVIDRVSQLVQRVLPHDVLGVGEISENGDRIRLLAVAGITYTQRSETIALLLATSGRLFSPSIHRGSNEHRHFTKNPDQTSFRKEAL